MNEPGIGVLVAELGVEGPIPSPTFTIGRAYRGRVPAFHLDLYRLESSEELAALGFDDLLSGSTIAALEWGDKFPEALPAHTQRFVFSMDGEARKIRRIS